MSISDTNNPPDLNSRLTTFVRRALALPTETPLTLTPLTKGGSARTFYRVSGREKIRARGMLEKASFIAMHYQPEPRENTLYAGIADFLRELGVAAPAVLAHDPEACFLLTEDLGDEDLWSHRNENWQRRRTLYKGVLEHAHRLHRYVQDDAEIPLPPLMEGYDAALYKWERDYFRREFVEGVCRVSLLPVDGKALEEEGTALAERLLESETGLIHRDLQSQNIMIRDGAPVLIDFQGMRSGSPFYDLGSLLYDPYVSLRAEERLELLDFYYRLSPRKLDWPTFITRFHEGSAQRLMQALGAYGFLGHRNGRADFRAHIPTGLRHLAIVTSCVSSLPCLRYLVGRCLDALSLDR